MRITYLGDVIVSDRLPASFAPHSARPTPASRQHGLHRGALSS